MGYKFDVYDYVVLILVLSVSVIIGFIYAIEAKYGSIFKRIFKRQTSMEHTEGQQMLDYFNAGGKMSSLPLGLSLLASCFSANSLLGVPAEVYLYGSEYFLMIIGIIPCTFFGAYITGPMFKNLKSSSVFEYLRLRYDSNVIYLAATNLYVIRSVLTAAIFIYGPATTITALTTLTAPIAVVLIGAVATFYTTIGGMKAVIWTGLRKKNQV
jgi:Na+/proline symporter